MYIEQAFKVLHDWWRYLLGVLIAIVGIGILSMPHALAIGVKQVQGEVDLEKLNDVNYIMTLFEPNVNLLFLLLPFAGGFFALLLAVKLLHKQSFAQLTTARKKIDWSRFWFAFGLWGFVSVAMIALDYYMSPDDYLLNFNLVPFLLLCLIAILLVPLQTSFEEYLFRGYLMQGLGVASKNRKFPIILIVLIVSVPLYIYLDSSFILEWYFKLLYFAITLLVFVVVSIVPDRTFNTNSYDNLFKLFNRKWIPLIITSAVFGLLHYSNPEMEVMGNKLMIYYIGTGLFLGILTLMDDGMELALGFHLANNLFTALLVTADWTAFQTHSVLKDLSDPTEAGLAEIFVPIFVVFPIMLFIFARKYKWNNWIERLFGKVEAPVDSEVEEIGNPF